MMPAPPWTGVRERLVRYGRLARANRPSDLPLFAWPALWGLWLGRAGHPSLGTVIIFLLALLLLRSGMWVAAPLLGVPASTQGDNKRRERLWLTGALFLGGLAFALPLGWITLLLALSPAFAAVYPYLIRRSYLAQLTLAAATAWAAPVGFLLHGAAPGKLAGLLFVAALAWSAAALIQYSFPQRTAHARSGLRTLPLMFGNASALVVAALELTALLALWFAGRQAELGVFHTLGLATALGLTAYQYYLGRFQGEGGWRRAYLANAWWGLAIFCGITFHYLCRG